MRLTAFFKLYKICILLHRCNLKIFAKNRFEKSAIFVKIQQKINFKVCKCCKFKSANFAKFQNFQLDNLVDFEKCCKTRIFLQKSVLIQPKTSNILPKFCRSAVGLSFADLKHHRALPAGAQPGSLPSPRGLRCPRRAAAGLRPCPEMARLSSTLQASPAPPPAAAAATAATATAPRRAATF